MQLFGGGFTAARGYAGGAGFDPDADSVEIDGEVVAVSELQEVPEIWGDIGCRGGIGCDEVSGLQEVPRMHTDYFAPLTLALT